MAFTQNLQLVNPVPGDPSVKNAWGAIENLDRALVDSAITGILTLDLSTATNPNTTYYVLSSIAGQPDQARNARFVFTGVLTANVTVFWPAGLQRIFSAVNNTTGPFSLTLAVNNGAVPPAAAGSTVTIQQGNTQNLASDGANVQPNGISTVFPGGTSMIFRQASAPPGWVQDTSANDRVLRMVSGATGGATGGNWTISGITSTVTVAPHVLAYAEMPPHFHNININSGTESAAHSHGGVPTITGNRASSGGDVFTNACVDAAYDNFTAAENQAHFHNVAGPTDTQGGGAAHSHTGSATIATDGAWRPAYTDVIVCTKS